MSVLYSSSTREFLVQINDLLESFSINLGCPYASGNQQGLELRSFSKSQIKRFFAEISSYQPKKLGRFKARVAQW